MEWSPRERPEDDCDEGDGEEVDVDTEENHHSQNHQQQQGMSDFLMLMSGRHQQQQNLLAQQQWAMFNDQNKNGGISGTFPLSLPVSFADIFSLFADIYFKTNTVKALIEAHALMKLIS